MREVWMKFFCISNVYYNKTLRSLLFFFTMVVTVDISVKNLLSVGKKKKKIYGTFPLPQHPSKVGYKGLVVTQWIHFSWLSVHCLKFLSVMLKKVALNTPENASCKNAKLLVNSRATCIFEVFLTAHFQVKLFKVSKLVLLQPHTLKQCKL